MQPTSNSRYLGDFDTRFDDDEEAKMILKILENAYNHKRINNN